LCDHYQPEAGIAIAARNWHKIMEFQDLINEAENRRLSLKDIAAFCSASKLPAEARLESCALVLARAYASGSVDFAIGDDLANVLFGYAAQHTAIPDLLFSVFLAFDAGEFYPDDIRSPSPEERFTRPRIRDILEAYDGGS
jgi:hypothetical protein